MKPVPGPRGLKAEGSIDWCLQTADLLRLYLKNIERTWKDAREVLKELEGVKAWNVLPSPEDPYGTEEAMCKALYGMSIRDIRRNIQLEEVKQAQSHGGDRRSATRVQGDAITLNRGTDPSYIVARLKRDDPDMAERVVNGELTANTAARQKGWRYPRILLTSPESIAKKLAEHLEPNALPELAELLLQEFERRGGHDA